MVAKGEVEVLESSPDTLGGSGHSLASYASALLSQTLDAFHRVRRFKQEPRHEAPFSAVHSQQSHWVADLLNVSRHPGEAPMRGCPTCHAEWAWITARSGTHGSRRVHVVGSAELHRAVWVALSVHVSRNTSSSALDEVGLTPAAGPRVPASPRCLPYVEESVHACCRDDRPWGGPGRRPS